MTTTRTFRALFILCLAFVALPTPARADDVAATARSVVRIVSISESGGYSPPSPVMYRMEARAQSAPPPIAAGEVAVNVNVTVQFELAP